MLAIAKVTTKKLSKYTRSKYQLGWHQTSHSTLRSLAPCAERSEPAMCVYESYKSQTGMMAQLDKFHS